MTKSTLFKATFAGLVFGVAVLASTVLAASHGEPQLATASGEGPCPTPLINATAFEGEPLLTPESGGVVYTSGSCSAWATCDDGSTVDCSSSSSSGTCSFQDADCDNGIRGHVECDGSKTWCPECPEDCSSLNYPGCSYFWNDVLGCCDVKSLDGSICLQAC